MSENSQRVETRNCKRLWRKIIKRVLKRQGPRVRARWKDSPPFSAAFSIELVDRRCAAVLVLAYIRGHFICQTAPEIEMDNLQYACLSV